MKLKTRDAVKLFHEGSIALAQVEANGMKVDVPYVKSKIASLDKEIATLERKLESSKLFKIWKRVYGLKTKLGSKEQLAHILFDIEGFECKERTETNKPKADETALLATKHPFCVDYVRVEKLKKANGTYLKGLLREVTSDGFVHPSYNLHLVSSYRSSASNPNVQNQPARNPEISELIRKCYVPRKSYRSIGEVDFSGAEVRVSACYNKDPMLIKYIIDPSTDMHRDQAAELFLLPIEFLTEQVGWAKKTVRDWAKNRFVFPQFYGSVYFQCAPHIWEAIENKHELGDKIPGLGVTIKEHLANKGVSLLGDCSADNKHPKEGTFVRHVQKVERKMWDEKFPIYTQWKQQWWQAYLQRGVFTTLTGFYIEGIFKRNEVLNLGIQGSAFHCDLWSLIRIVKWLRKYRMKSLVIGEVHDSIVFDAHPKELDDFLSKCKEVMTKDLPKAWNWLIVPMAVEAEVAPPGKSWFDKKKVEIK